MLDHLTFDVMLPELQHVSDRASTAENEARAKTEEMQALNEHVRAKEAEAGEKLVALEGQLAMERDSSADGYAALEKRLMEEVETLQDRLKKKEEACAELEARHAATEKEFRENENRSSEVS